MVVAMRFAISLICLISMQLLLVAQPAWAGPVYVYREAGGVIHFSSKPPPPGIKAEVFTAKGGGGSIIHAPMVGYRFRYRGEYKDIVSLAAKMNAVDPALVMAVIHAESGFNPRAISPKGAQGLMQLMPDTARMYGIRKLFEPKENIEAGTRHLAMLLRKFNGKETTALAAYNAGEEAVGQYGGIPPYQETQNYVRRVLHLKSIYSSKKYVTG